MRDLRSLPKSADGMPRLPRKAWLFIGVFVWGVIVGGEFSPEPEVITETVTETETITEEVEVEVPVPTVPESCMSVIYRVMSMQDYSGDLSYTAAEQLRILTESNIAIGSPQVEDNNTLKQDQINLDAASTSWRVNLDEDITDLARAREACDRDMENHD